MTQAKAKTSPSGSLAVEGRLVSIDIGTMAQFQIKNLTAPYPGLRTTDVVNSVCLNDGSVVQELIVAHARVNAPGVVEVTFRTDASGNPPFGVREFAISVSKFSTLTT